MIYFHSEKTPNKTEKTCAKYRSKINKNNGRCALKHSLCILFHYIDWLGFSSLLSPPSYTFVFVALFLMWQMQNPMNEKNKIHATKWIVRSDRVDIAVYAKFSHALTAADSIRLKLKNSNHVFCTLY